LFDFDSARRDHHWLSPIKNALELQYSFAQRTLWLSSAISIMFELRREGFPELSFATSCRETRALPPTD
jgi:hypothetical protein